MYRVTTEVTNLFQSFRLVGGAAHPVTPSLEVAEQLWLGFEDAHWGVSKNVYMMLVTPAFRALLTMLSRGAQS